MADAPLCPACRRPLAYAGGIGRFCATRNCPVLDDDLLWSRGGASEVQTPKSVAERLSPDLRMVLESSADSSSLHLNGRLLTQDQLDAAIDALTKMREWLPSPPGGDAQEQSR